MKVFRDKIEKKEKVFCTYCIYMCKKKDGETYTCAADRRYHCKGDYKTPPYWYVISGCSCAVYNDDNDCDYFAERRLKV